MSETFTLGYKLAWLPRMLLAGSTPPGPFPAAPIKHNAAAKKPAGAKRILFLGDLSAVANRRCPAFSPSFRTLCQSADIVFANLESPLSSQSIMPLQTRLGFSHAMEPQFLAEVLDAAAIPSARLAVSLANNHIADQGRAGLEKTVSVLQRMGITSVGLASARPADWERLAIGGARVAVLAFTQWIDRDADLFRDMIRCGPPAPVTGHAPPDADLACALPHWGSEFRFRADDQTRQQAARLAALGADVIAGTHPHVIQAMEKVGTALVAYSLGDFLGSVLAWTVWPLRLSLAISVDFIPGLAQGARILAYEAHLFFRVPEDGRERLQPIDDLPYPQRDRVGRFAMRVLAPSAAANAASVIVESPSPAQ